MKPGFTKTLRNISKVVLGVLIVLVVGYVGYITYSSIKNRPYKVRVSNVTDSAFTVSWVTDEPMVGVVYYGEKDNFLPGPLSWIGKKRAFDDRDVSDAQTECVRKFNKKVSKKKSEDFTVDASGFDCNDVKVIKKGEYYTHHVTVPNLDTDKEYYFRVGNGYISFKEGKTKGVSYIEREMPAISEFKQKTRETFKVISAPKPAYGTSFNFYRASNGFITSKNNFDSIIFLKTFKDGEQYPLMSAVTNNDGGWSIDLSNVRDEENNVLSLEGSFFEFIPQVDNARPATNGTVKYEEITFPLRILGNQSEDWEDKATSIKGENELSSKLLNKLVNKSYAATCLCKLGTMCKNLNKTFCENEGGTCVSSCPSTPPQEEIPWIQCWSFVNDKCIKSSVKRKACDGGGYFVSETACCANNPCGVEKTCYSCVQGELKTRTTKGNCYSDESTTKPVCSVEKTCYWCANGELKSRNTTGDCKSVESKDSLTCNQEVTCFCTENGCKNPVVKNGKTCGASTGCYDRKATCIDNKLADDGGSSGGGETVEEGNKTCCNLLVSGGCDCLEKQKTCPPSHPNQVSSKKDCESAESTVTGSPITTGCIKGKKYTYVPVSVVNGPVNMLTERQGLISKLLSPIFAQIPQPYGPNPQTDSYVCTKVERCFLNAEGEEEEIEQDIVSDEACLSDQINCITCWNHNDCSPVYRKKEDGCPNGYADEQIKCQGNALVPATYGTPGSDLYLERWGCTNEGSLEPAPNVERVIVARGCTGGLAVCYAQYRYKSGPLKGQACGNFRLEVGSVFCPVQGCPDLDVKRIGCGESCDLDKGYCVCAESCKDENGKVVKIPAGSDMVCPDGGTEKRDTEIVSEEVIDGGVYICNYKYEDQTLVKSNDEYVKKGTDDYNYYITGKRIQKCSDINVGLNNQISCYSENACYTDFETFKKKGEVGQENKCCYKKKNSSANIYDLVDCENEDRIYTRLVNGDCPLSLNNLSDKELCLGNTMYDSLTGSCLHDMVNLCKYSSNDGNNGQKVGVLVEGTEQYASWVSTGKLKECGGTNHQHHTQEQGGNMVNYCYSHNECPNKITVTVPTNVYSCKYNSDGKLQEQELKTPGTEWYAYWIDGNNISECDKTTLSGREVSCYSYSECSDEKTIDDAITCWTAESGCDKDKTIKMSISKCLKEGYPDEWACLTRNKELTDGCWLGTEFRLGSNKKVYGCQPASGVKRSNFGSGGCASGGYHDTYTACIKAANGKNLCFKADGASCKGFSTFSDCYNENYKLKPGAYIESTVCEKNLKDSVASIESEDRCEEEACTCKDNDTVIGKDFCCNSQLYTYTVTVYSHGAPASACKIDDSRRQNHNVTNGKFCSEAECRMNRENVILAELEEAGLSDENYYSETQQICSRRGGRRTNDECKLQEWSTLKGWIAKGDFYICDLEDCGISSSHTGSGTSLPFIPKAHAQSVNSEESLENNPFISYYPEDGIYEVTDNKGRKASAIGGSGGYVYYEERNGIDGYQSPEDPKNPKPNEDLIVPKSSLVEVEKVASFIDLPLKQGINIISFNLLPSTGSIDSKLSYSDFLNIANRKGNNVSRIATFKGGQWEGGAVYDFGTKEVKGQGNKTITMGIGYVIVAEQDTTISVPGYAIKSPIPIAFSEGWNLIGVHGHTKAYTAQSFINSINSTEGLQSNNVTWWPTSKGRYEGFQVSEGQTYGQDFPISPLNGYFVRINSFQPKEANCKSIIWNPGGQKNGECGTK